MAPTCANGTPYPHLLCEACWERTETDIMRFWQGVVEGKWDADGYTAAERRRLGEGRKRRT